MIYDLLRNYKFNTNIKYELIVENINKKIFLLKIDEFYYIAIIYNNLLLAEKDLLIFKEDDYIKNNYIPPIIKNVAGEKITVFQESYGIITIFLKNELNFRNKEKNTELILKEYLRFREFLNKNYAEINKKYFKNYSIESIINQCFLNFKNNNNYEVIKKILESIKKELNEALENTSIGEYIIHGDLHQGNIILNNNQLYIIDFEDVGIGSIFFDIATLFLEKNIIDSETAIKILKEYFKNDDIDIELNLKINIILVNLINICRKNYGNSFDKLLVDLQKIKLML